MQTLAPAIDVLPAAQSRQSFKLIEAIVVLYLPAEQRRQAEYPD
jgi:hypothetical protein